MHLVLSGATGYLGKHLLARSLRDGHMVTALVRGGGCERVLAALAPFALPARLTAAPRLRVIAADLARPVLACAAAVGECGRPDAFIHAAGLTRFDCALADELATHNLCGTQHAWGLARALAIPLFQHVGTAYVAGDAQCLFDASTLDVGQHFRNPYEATKFAAERWLHTVAPGSGTALVVQRPSVIVGGCPIGATHAVGTLYTFMQAVHFLRECCRRDTRARLGARRDGEVFHLPVRVAADACATVNLVAIDDVVDAVAETSCVAPTTDTVTTRALTGHDYPIAAVADAITATLRVSGVRLEPPTAFDAIPRTALEAHFHRLTQVYAPYLFGSPRFAPRPAARRVDVVQLTEDFRAAAARGRMRRTRGLGTLALDTLGIREPRDYFSALCDGAVGRDFLARHDYVDATVGFRLHGAYTCDVTLRVAGGRAAELTTGAAHTDCRYELDATLFMRIVQGAADLRASFLAGRVRITGNTELALKFGALLGLYYGRLDDHLLTELSA